MMTTPKEIGSTVRELAQKFGLTEEPIWIDVKTRADAIDRDCYKDVERQIAEFGGDIIYGWQIWEWPRILIEGEFHAVWRSPSGEIVDVSSKPDGEDRIIFIPDPNRKYEERQIDNIRHALWNHSLVHSYIEVCIAIHKLFDDNRIGELASLVDPQQMGALEMRKMQLHAKLMSFPRAKNKA